MGSPPFTHKYAQFGGLVVSDGQEVSKDLKDPSARDIFVRNRDGSTEIRPAKKVEDLSKIRDAACGFGIILKDGKIEIDSSKVGSESLHPRVAMGLDSGGKHIFLLTIDGRQPKVSEDATQEETAKLLEYFGAKDGILMDGGGSTTLLISDSPKKIKMLNKHKGGAERKVATSMVFVLKKK